MRCQACRGRLAGVQAGCLIDRVERALLFIVKTMDGTAVRTIGSWAFASKRDSFGAIGDQPRWREHTPHSRRSLNSPATAPEWFSGHGSGWISRSEIEDNRTWVNTTVALGYTVTQQPKELTPYEKTMIEMAYKDLQRD